MNGFWGVNVVSFLMAPLILFSSWFSAHAPFFAGESTTTTEVACTMEAKQCPDGSWVGRTGPSCTFAACPGATSTPIQVAPKPAPTPKPTPLPVVHAISIYSITPLSGVVGTEVTIDGVGFTNDNTIHFGYGVIVHVPISGSIAIACATSRECKGGIHETLRFTVPYQLEPACRFSMPACMIATMMTAPGAYAVSVSNDNGTSNPVQFTVVGTTGGGDSSVSVSGLDAPTSLSIGTSGTWTVHAESSSLNSNLHYGVVWGDEVNPAGQAMIPAPTTIQTSATFTHVYQRSGTYTVRFTVSDDSGHSAQTSATVVVTPLLY